MRVVNSLPESLPAIDFDMYKTKVAVPGMVETFEKSYSGLQVPYPADQV
jgi:F-type H+-transporting ATPase subunit d